MAENLRCPPRVSEIVGRASSLYGALTKDLRPRKQGMENGGRPADAHVVTVDLASAYEADQLLGALIDMDDLALVSPEPTLPSWIPSEYAQSILLPEAAKGLEYSSVVLLGVGPLLTSMKAAQAHVERNPLSELAHRMFIDRLRVGLSRATETLALVDYKPSKAERQSRDELLEGAAPYSVHDLIELLSQDDLTPEERVNARLGRAMKVLENNHGLAWRSVLQAASLLGHPDDPDSVQSPALRRRTYATLLSIAAYFLVEKPPRKVSRDQVRREALRMIECPQMHLIPEASWGERLKEAGFENERALERQRIANRWDQSPGLREDALEEFDQGKAAAALARLRELEAQDQVAQSEALLRLYEWTERMSEPPFALLDAVLRIGGRGRWAREAFTRVAQTLRSHIFAGAEEAETAREFQSAPIEGWLELTGVQDSAADMAREVRASAVRTLIRAGDLEGATAVEASIAPADLIVRGELLEAKGRQREAGEAYLEAGVVPRARRSLRIAGEWAAAMQLTPPGPDEPEMREDLEWLQRLQSLLADRPDGLLARCEPEELEGILRRFQPRKHARS